LQKYTGAVNLESDGIRRHAKTRTDEKRKKEGG